MRQGSQILPQEEEDNQIQPQRIPSWSMKLMIGYLYFAQGFIYEIARTMPYVYKTLPDYFTLSLFSFSMLPFAFKFVTAPLLQKYTNIDYGKRKTWIIISQISAALLLFLSSFFTGEDQAQKFACLLFPIYTAISLQDIALDALCLKQLIDAKLMSLMQSSCQMVGYVTGSLILLKGTSLEFASKIGLSQPITNTETILLVITLLLFIPSILIHFFYNETKLDADEQTIKEPISKVYAIYKYFFKKQYRYCWIIIILLFYHQGLNFHYAGYWSQLVQNGFSRDTLNTIDNVKSIVISGLVMLFGMNANYLGFKKSFILQVSLLTVFSFSLWIFFPISVPLICVTALLQGLIGQWGVLLKSNLCAYFPENGATGMIYTMNASFATMGRNMFIHTAILKKIPWRISALFGYILMIPTIVIFIPQMIDLAEKGETSIQFEKSQNYEKDGIENKNQLE